MKSAKAILIICAGIALLGLGRVQASVTLNLNEGFLQTNVGGTDMPLNGLLQLVVSTSDNVFTAPTAASFTGGSADDQIVDSWSLNQAFGVGTDSHSSVITYSGALTQGEEMMLRWYPTLTIASGTPGSGTIYGEFRTAAVENGSDIAWVTPADGGTYALNFQTVSFFGGTEPDSAGIASFAVIPEPPPLVLALGGFFLSFAVLRRKKPFKA